MAFHCRRVELKEAHISIVLEQSISLAKLEVFFDDAMTKHLSLTLFLIRFHHVFLKSMQPEGMSFSPMFLSFSVLNERVQRNFQFVLFWSRTDLHLRDFRANMSFHD